MENRGCSLDTDGDGNCPVHLDGCPDEARETWTKPELKRDYAAEIVAMVKAAAGDRATEEDIRAFLPPELGDREYTTEQVQDLAFEVARRVAHKVAEKNRSNGVKPPWEDLPEGSIYSMPCEAIEVQNGHQHGVDGVVVLMKMRGKPVALIQAMTPIDALTFAKSIADVAMEVRAGQDRADSIVGGEASIIVPKLPKARKS